MSKSLLIVLATALLIPTLAAARGKDAPTAPGTYKAWGPDIDTIEIVKTFKAADYDTIVVTPFDTAAAPLPEKSEKSYDSVKSALDSYTESFTEALRDAMKGKATVTMASSAPKKSKALLIRGKVEAIDPGSRAKRYLGGFGAGSAANRMSGEIVDAATGKVLLKFTQERRSGGTWKFAGGNDVQVMRDSIHAMGQDVAHILEQFK